MTTDGFIHDAVGARIVFGAGRVAQVPQEVARLGQRPLLITTRSAEVIAGRLRDAFGGGLVGAIDRVRQHVPAGDADAARSQARELRADCLVCVGGGSAIGLAKAVALTDRLPILAVPTTYSGSEITPVWGITADGVKTTGRDANVAPRVVVYDPELTSMLSAAVAAASGLNALAHCVDGLWAPGHSPLSDVIAERGITALRVALPAVVRDGRESAAQAEALIGAWMAGATLGVTGTSVHHKICHALGGRFDLPHAETHAVVLPWVVDLLVPRLPETRRILARAFGGAEPVGALRHLQAELGLPTRLADLGLTEDQARALADDLDLEALASPSPVSRAELRALLLAATTGA